MATGFEKDRFVNRCNAIDELGRGQARQLVFDGRASNPLSDSDDAGGVAAVAVFDAAETLPA